MKKIMTAFVVTMLVWSVSLANAQEAKPYKEGMVTEVSYIKIKNGRFDDYMRFLSTTYKTRMEAQKKAGLIVNYRIFSMQAKTPHDPDMMLTTTYANMAALDKSDESDMVSVQSNGPLAEQSKASIDRDAMREVLGGELIRELVLK